MELQSRSHTNGPIARCKGAAKRRFIACAIFATAKYGAFEAVAQVRIGGVSALSALTLLGADSIRRYRHLARYRQQLPHARRACAIYL